MTKKLCEVFGHTQLKKKRVFHLDKTTLRCPKCKGKYDTEILGKYICPNCQTKMRYQNTWVYHYSCKSCGYKS